MFVFFVWKKKDVIEFGMKLFIVLFFFFYKFRRYDKMEDFFVGIKSVIFCNSILLVLVINIRKVFFIWEIWYLCGILYLVI